MLSARSPQLRRRIIENTTFMYVNITIIIVEAIIDSSNAGTAKKIDQVIHRATVFEK